MIKETETEFVKHEYNNVIRHSLEHAKVNYSKLPDWILGMEGMSGRKYRHFINNLIRNIRGPRYLEIGSWKGSTSCSAIYNNYTTAFFIDNWSQFGGPKTEFLNTVDRCKRESEIKPTYFFMEEDFRKVDYKNIGKYNVYLFDGPHEAQDQFDALDLVYDALEDTFIYICDDWNWDKVRSGTYRALFEESTKYEVLYYVDIRTTLDDSHPKISMQNSDWHNGYFLSVCRKSLDNIGSSGKMGR